MIDSAPEYAEHGWPAAFRDAARTFDWDRVHAITVDYLRYLAAEPEPPRREIDSVLRLLREHLRHEDLRDVADTVLALGLSDDAGSRLQYAQALVDSGSPSGARIIYESILSDPHESATARAEARGGVGRCEKQRFLATTEPARRQRHLHRSIAAYGDAYRDDPGRYWHGINYVAMVARGLRERLVAADTHTVASVSATARDILTTIARAPHPDPWQRATECEALVALGRDDGAVSSAAAFLADPAVTPFMINALLRQLVDVWELDARASPGSSVLPMLRSALLARRGGRVVVSIDDVQEGRRTPPRQRLEKVLGHSRYQSLTWYRKGLMRCRAVARIETQVEDGIGSGFLVRGPDLHPGLPERVLVTNAHVVPEGLPPDECVIAFHGLDGAQPGSFGVRRVIWTQPSAHGSLDTTILELDGVPADVEPIPLAPRLPALSAGLQRAYVIGHPRGLEQPQFSLQDNAVLDWDDRLVHYRSPTEGGSSGSPVFNGEWLLIGLHHAGSQETCRLHGRGGTYAANEAISVEAIRTAVRSDAP